MLINFNIKEIVRSKYNSRKHGSVLLVKDNLPLDEMVNWESWSNASWYRRFCARCDSKDEQGTVSTNRKEDLCAFIKLSLVLKAEQFMVGGI